jgi:ABC-type transporter Mla MlaB component
VPRGHCELEGVAKSRPGVLASPPPGTAPGVSDEPEPDEGLALPSVLQSVAAARRYAVGTCRARGYRGDCDTLALLVSEVATNALIHGAGQVRVRVLLQGPGCGSRSPTTATPCPPSAPSAATSKEAAGSPSSMRSPPPGGPTRGPAGRPFGSSCRGGRTRPRVRVSSVLGGRGGVDEPRGRGPAGGDRLGTAATLGADIADALATGADPVEVDFAAVTFCDSTGLQVLVNGAKHARALDRGFFIKHPTESLLRLADLLGASDPDPRVVAGSGAS